MLVKDPDAYLWLMGFRTRRCMSMITKNECDYRIKLLGTLSRGKSNLVTKNHFNSYSSRDGCIKQTVRGFREIQIQKAFRNNRCRVIHSHLKISSEVKSPGFRLKRPYAQLGLELNAYPSTHHTFSWLPSSLCQKWCEHRVV